MFLPNADGSNGWGRGATKSSHVPVKVKTAHNVNNASLDVSYLERQQFKQMVRVLKKGGINLHVHVCVLLRSTCHEPVRPITLIYSSNCVSAFAFQETS